MIPSNLMGVDGGHLGNMLIRTPWDIFLAGNIFFLNIDVLAVLNIVVEFRFMGVAWEPISPARLFRAILWLYEIDVLETSPKP